MIHGTVYKIINSVDDEVYVGSTTKTKEERMYKHRTSSNRQKHYKLYKHFSLIGLDKFEIIVIEDDLFENKQELYKLEGFYINLLGTLNSNIAGRTMKEYYMDHIEDFKQYYLNNREDILRYQNQYKIDKREEITKKNKQYYEENKVKIICECGRTILKRNLSRHLKSKVHQDWFNRK